MALTQFSALIVAVVALASLVLTIIIFLGYLRTRNRKILFVAGALATHFVKSSIVAVALQFSLMGHESIEVVEALFDLAMVTLLFIPFVVRD